MIRIPVSRNRIAWILAATFFAGSVINYLDRAVLSVVMPQIRKDLFLSNSGYGFAVNSFLVPYMIFYIVGGRLADRWGYRKTFTLTVAFWSIASMLQGLSRGLGSLCFFRALLGIGEGTYYPTAIRGLSEWFTPENRAKAIGVLLCGVSVGALLTPPVVASIASSMGWRASFLITGGSGFLLVFVWLYLNHAINRTFRNPGQNSSKNLNCETTYETPILLREILWRKKYWFLLMARAVTDAAWFFYLFWIPGYFQIGRGFTLVEVGQWLWIPFFFADLGALAGAWASGALIRSGLGLDPSRKIVLGGSILLALFGLGTYYIQDQTLALSCISLCLFGHFSWASNIHTVITEVVPRQHVAVLYGITGAVGTGLGAVGQYFVGLLVDRGGYELPFVGSSLIYVLAIVFLFSAGKIEPMEPGENPLVSQ